jgi:small ligand-binding sensory domain FIST
MSGNLSVDTIVAQGCRPIGDPMFANATHENLILELDGKMPRETLSELYQRIKRSDRKLFTEALFLGLAMQPQREQYLAGDFLIRTILGLDPDSGALLVNTHIPPHSVVQLHVRDAVTSAQDLQQLLSHYRNSHDLSQVKGIMLFSCLGRGSGFYGHAGHDSNACKQLLGDLPIGGFFCNGEIGPVRGVTHMHGYTSVFGIFSSRQPLAS